MRHLLLNTTFLGLISAAATMFVGCADEAVVTENAAPEIKGVVITAPAFIPESGMTRTEVDIKESGADFIWQASDIVGIYPDQGTQVRFPMENGAGSNTAEFDGGGWAVKGAYSYMAYYPFIPDMNMEKTAIPADYTGQCQHGSGNHDHIGRYDYMTASRRTPTVTGTVGFDFCHMGALVRLTLVVPKPNTYTSLTLQTEGSITVKGTFDITQDPIAIEPTETAHEFTISLSDLTTTANNETVVIYLMLPPSDLSGYDTYAILRSENTEFRYLLTRKNYEAGKIYAPAAGNGSSSEVVRLINGGDFNSRIKELANRDELTEGEEINQGTTDHKIKKIIFRPNSDFVSNPSGKYVDVADPACTDCIYAVWNATEGSITIHSDKDIIRCNESAGDMFRQLDDLETIDFSGFSTLGTIDFSRMFQESKSLKSADLTSFDFSDATNITEMFKDCENLSSVTLPNRNNLSNINGMEAAWSGCQNLKSIDLSLFTAENIDVMNTLQGCSALETVKIGKLHISRGIGTFSGCASLKSLDLSGCDFSQATSLYGFCSGCEALEEITFASTLDTRNVEDMTDMFGGCSSLTSIDLSNFNTQNVKDMHSMFGGCSSLTTINLSTFDTQKVTDMYGMFANCSSLTTIDLSTFRTAKVWRMSSMFEGCSNLVSVVLSSFSGEKLREMSQMFYGCSNLLSVDLSSIIAPSLQKMENTFCGCTGLESITFGANFKTSRCENFSHTFFECTSLETLDVSMFDTKSALTLNCMFGSCQALQTLDLKNFNTAHVTDIRDLFYDCPALKSLDISNFEINDRGSLEGEWPEVLPNQLETINYGKKWNYSSLLLPDSFGEDATTSAPKQVTCLPAFKQKLTEYASNLLTRAEEGTVIFINALTGEKM